MPALPDNVYVSPGYVDALINPEVYGDDLYDTGLTPTASDSLATLTDAVVRSATYVRVVSESISSITETASAGYFFTRTVTETISSITASVGRVLTGSRTTSETVATLTESVSQTTTSGVVAPQIIIIM